MADVAEEIKFCFSVYNIRDYSTIISLIKEHNLPLISVQTASEIIPNKGEKTVVKIRTKGDKNILDFIGYLASKEQDRVNKLLKRIKVKEEEIE